LGGGKVIIESQGLRHEISATATPAGTIDIGRDVTPIAERVGTTIYLDMPYCTIDIFWWGRAFALLNPHATVKISEFDYLEFTI